jgi:hypothetical protein
MKTEINHKYYLVTDFGEDDSLLFLFADMNGGGRLSVLGKGIYSIIIRFK